ncbi:hypothetical protein AVEN_173981-1 [Araneus ventricosus]|uniref:Uncharacterized protein n=1 Tax=Araneus ventricosus TaxID=182803 RepID=A0A4Y2K284_ARAVE|nr:hypothetical protein AVEN_173981-1 [Araneus ventricosus]
MYICHFQYLPLSLANDIFKGKLLRHEFDKSLALSEERGVVSLFTLSQSCLVAFAAFGLVYVRQVCHCAILEHTPVAFASKCWHRRQAAGKVPDNF